MKSSRITILDVRFHLLLLSLADITVKAADDSALPERVRGEVYKAFPEAKIAQLRDGGNFAYVARSDEVNLHLEVHLKRNKYGRLAELRQENEQQEEEQEERREPQE